MSAATGRAGAAATPPAAATVTARPVRMALVAYICASAVLIVMAAVAVLQPSDNAGASFNQADQIATAIIGVILAGLCTIPARPRLLADADGVHIKQFLGGWRTVPWELVVRVEFARRTRFARLVLPGEEAIGLYAVQRWDGDRSVEVMRRLRELHATCAPKDA